jgi:MFS family permease
MKGSNPPHDPYAVLRIRDFRLFLYARLAMTIAFQMEEVVLGWQIFALTKDPLSLGIIGLVGALPALALLLYTGHLSDRKDRRLISLMSLLVFVLCAAAFYLISFHVEAVYSRFGAIPFYAVMFISGTASAFFSPAIISFGTQLIPSELYAGASAWRSSTWQTGAIAGPALGGLLYGFVGAQGGYITVGLLFFLSLIWVAMIPSKGVPKTGGEESIVESLKQGIKFVFKNQIIVGALSLDLFAVLFGGAVAMLPVYASDILKIGPEGLGLLRAAPSVGAVCVALWMAHRPLSGEVGKKLFAAVAAFGLTIIIFGISESVYLSVLMLALGGAFDSVSVIIRSTLLNLSTPNEMRGRVEAVNLMFIGSSNEIGAFESGVAAKIMRVVPSVVFGGCMTLVSVFTTARLAPVLRTLTYEELTAQTTTAVE